MNSKDRGYDDLTVIEHIGRARQEWLRDKFQVRTYRDLAALSLDDIESQLAEDGKPYAKSDIEEFLAVAKALADQVEEEAKQFKSAEGWENQGIFVVNIWGRTVEGGQEYLTEVSIHENGEQAKSEEWLGLEGDHSFQWMLEQAGIEPIPSVPQPESEEQPELEEALPAVELEGEAEVKVSRIQVFQPPDAGEALASSEAGEPLQEKLKAGEPFSLAVQFSLGGDGAQSVVKSRANYRASVVANEINKNVGTNLGDTDPESLVEGSLDYCVKTPEATLAAGKYQLWAMITVQADNTLPNFLEVPSLAVV